MTSTLLDPSAPALPATPRSVRLQGVWGLSVPSVVIAGITTWLVWIALSTLERAGKLGAVLAAGRAEIVAPLLIGVVAAMLVCERVWPVERRHVRARGHVHDACYFALHVAAVVPLMTLLGVAFATLMGTLAESARPTFSDALPQWVVLAAVLVMMDGCNWLAHLADHRYGALWRLHALHHTQEEVNVLTSFRAHPLSHLMGFFLATIPVLVVVGDRPVAPILITLYICLS